MLFWVVVLVDIDKLTLFLYPLQNESLLDAKQYIHGDKKVFFMAVFPKKLQ